MQKQVFHLSASSTGRSKLLLVAVLSVLWIVVVEPPAQGVLRVPDTHTEQPLVQGVAPNALEQRPSHTLRAADSAGSLAPGHAFYPVPRNAVIAAPWGSDASPGTMSSPVRTVDRALSIIASGGTVVLRRGVYREEVVTEEKVTIQNYPGEAAWLDGSTGVSGWVEDGPNWRHDGWTSRFDDSVGFSKGSVDGTSPGWQWVDPNFPMAPHPDQVFIDGIAQRQVRQQSSVAVGSFFLDEDTSRLYLGTNPSGHEIRASSLSRGLRVRGEGSVVRGIGLRRFAPSIWQIGALTIEAPKVTVENVTILDSATIGVGVVSADVVLSKVSVMRAGLLGVHAGTADRLLVSSSRVDQNNAEHFNSAPVSGGMKVGRSRTVTVTNSSISDNLGPGYWSDVSVYDTRIINSNVEGNRATGVFLEISARGTVANNIIADNGGDGVKVNNTSRVAIYNNTVVRNGRALNLVQDARRPDNTSYGQDRRFSSDPEMNWMLGPVTVRNNVLGMPNSAVGCVLCVEDYTHKRTASQIGVTSNGNVFNRFGSRSSRWLTVWSRGDIGIDPAVYTTLAHHQNGTGEDENSISYEKSAVVTADGTLAGSVQGRANEVAVPLPSDIADLTGQTVGRRHLGAFGRG